jgi:oligo-1,6-glucosidase
MKSRWWKECVVYQIYPRSFCDSNDDGIGDLRGIISKLDYLALLGVDVVWLSPVYPSPGDDNGYDVSDYCAIDPIYGSLTDWRDMLREMHRRGIKLLMDLVVNHTSDEHPWFQQSREGKNNPYRDYYIWRPPRDGSEPNNWASCFGGSAWQWDERTGEYYLHLFSPKQPDLNWENPRVRDEVFNLMTWWLEQGVDGFRLDVINMISKVPGLPDAPVRSDRKYQWAGQYFLHGPRLGEFLAAMKSRVLSKFDAFTVGEAPGVTTEHAVHLTSEETGSLNMLFQFEHIDVGTQGSATFHGKWGPGRWQLHELKTVITRWQRELQGRAWNSFYLSNHDQPRSVSRFGDGGQYRVESAKMLATFLHLLHGTPYIYQGEELGMTNVAFDSIDDYRDIETLNFYREWVLEQGENRAAVMAAIHAKSRDNSRTPMQWSAAPQAGFTSGRPWINVNPNYLQINAEDQCADPDSIFHYYRRLVKLRRENPIVTYGSYELLLESHEQVFAFLRTLDRIQWLVALNFSGDSAAVALPSHLPSDAARLVISNYGVEPTENIRLFTLRPFEARVYALAGTSNASSESETSRES